MSRPEDQLEPAHPVAGAATGSHADVTWISPAAAEVAAQLFEPQADVVDLVTAANEAARAVHTAVRVRDRAIRRALAAGAGYDELATATALSVEQLQRIRPAD